MKGGIPFGDRHLYKRHVWMMMSHAIKQRCYRLARLKRRSATKRKGEFEK